MVEGSDESVRRPRFLNLGTILFAVLMFAGSYWLRPFLATRNLNTLVADANADLPKMLDADTRLDRLSGSSEGVVYHLTVMHEIDFTRLLPRLEAQTRTTYCERTRGLVNDGFAVEWRYSRLNGQPLGAVKHWPSDCR